MKILAAAAVTLLAWGTVWLFDEYTARVLGIVAAVFLGIGLVAWAWIWALGV